MRVEGTKGNSNILQQDVSFLQMLCSLSAYHFYQLWIFLYTFMLKDIHELKYYFL